MICVSQRQAALLGKPVDALIHRHAKGLHSHRHQVVLADRENYIHQLLRVVPGVELGPGPITDVGVAMQLSTALNRTRSKLDPALDGLASCGEHVWSEPTDKPAN